MYRANREHRNLARWIEEAVKNLSRRNLEVLMDQDSIKICREKKKEGLDRRESVEKLSRLRKEGFSRREKHIEMNATSKLLNKDPINMLSSQNISQQICKAFINPKHTHTHTHTKQV